VDGVDGITPLEALKAITINAAYQYMEEKSKGSLENGKIADLVILDKNPLKVDPKSDQKILRLSRPSRMGSPSTRPIDQRRKMAIPHSAELHKRREFFRLAAVQWAAIPGLARGTRHRKMNVS
jgi:cytosine/adenosine deaminase-related metal-dependent hydrolase